MPNAEDFRDELNRQIRRAENDGRTHVDIRSGDLHEAVGGYPGTNHSMPSCCNVMYAEMNNRIGSTVLASPSSGKGANLVIRYKLMSDIKSNIDDFDYNVFSSIFSMYATICIGGSCIPLVIGLYKMFAYDNPNLATAYFVLFGAFFIGGVILATADAILKRKQ